MLGGGCMFITSLKAKHSHLRIDSQLNSAVYAIHLWNTSASDEFLINSVAAKQ
jgi:hypothetical protein